MSIEELADMACDRGLGHFVEKTRLRDQPIDELEPLGVAFMLARLAADYEFGKDPMFQMSFESFLKDALRALGERGSMQPEKSAVFGDEAESLGSQDSGFGESGYFAAAVPLHACCQFLCTGHCSKWSSGVSARVCPYVHDLSSKLPCQHGAACAKEHSKMKYT